MRAAIRQTVGSPLRAAKGDARLDTPRLVTVLVGLPRSLGRDGAGNPLETPWVSAIFKEPVDGRVRAGCLGLAGDGQADLRNHGGPDRALLAFGADHYPACRAELGMPDLAHGAFGENLAIAGLEEDTVCVGDAYRIGPVLVQVSQPRQPCGKLDRRLGRTGVLAMALATGRAGWYLRVLEEGDLEAGLPVERTSRPHPEWTIRRAMQAMHARVAEPEVAAELARCPLLSEGWRATLAGS